MDDRIHRERVAAGALALIHIEDDPWVLARLTYEECDRADRIGEALAKWAEEVREETRRTTGRARPFSASTAARYRAIWIKYGNLPLEERPSWTEADDSIRGVTPEAEARYAAKYALKVGLREAPADVKAAAIAEALDDPETRTAVAQQVEARMDAAERERVREMTDPTAAALRREAADHEGGPLTDARHGLEGLRADTQLAKAIHGWAKACAAFVEAVDSSLPRLTPEALDAAVFLPGALAAARGPVGAALERLQRLERAVEEGETDLDAFLSGVLKGG